MNAILYVYLQSALISPSSIYENSSLPINESKQNCIALLNMHIPQVSTSYQHILNNLCERNCCGVLDSASHVVSLWSSFRNNSFISRLMEVSFRKKFFGKGYHCYWFIYRKRQPLPFIWMDVVTLLWKMKKNCMHRIFTVLIRLRRFVPS